MKASVAWRQERFEPGAVDGVQVHESHDFSGSERCRDCGCTRGMVTAEDLCFLGNLRRRRVERDRRRLKAKQAARAKVSGR